MRSGWDRAADSAESRVRNRAREMARQGAPAWSHASSNTLAVIQPLKSSLSMNRASALSCSMRALASSGVLARVPEGGVRGDLAGIVFVMSFPTPVPSSQARSPNRSWKVLMMFESESSSGSGIGPPQSGRHGVDLGVFDGQQDLLHRALLDPVAVHVDGIKDALGQVLLLGRRQLRDQEVQKDRALLPVGVGVGQDARPGNRRSGRRPSPCP